MNKINPLYVGIFLIVVFIVVSLSLKSSKEELQETKLLLQETRELAIEVSEYKKIYAKKSKKSLEKIVKLGILKSANLEIKKSKKSMSIFSKSMDKNALNYLMGKLLNSAYNIESLRVKKLSNEKVSLYVEIKW